MKKQRISAWQLSACGTREACSYVLLQSLRRFFALINKSPFPCRVQWKARIVQWKGSHRAMESWSSQQVFTSIYVTPSEPGHMDNPILQLHEQDALHRLVNAIDR